MIGFGNAALGLVRGKDRQRAGDRVAEGQGEAAPAAAACQAARGEGTWRRDGDVRNLIAAHAEDLTGLLGVLSMASRDFTKFRRPAPEAVDADTSAKVSLQSIASDSGTGSKDRCAAPARCRQLHRPPRVPRAW